MEASEQASPEPEQVDIPPVVTDADIVFICAACQRQLVVHRDGEGLQVPCPGCGQPVVIPPYRPAPTPPPTPEAVRRFDFTGFSREQLGRRMEELRHQLKENRSQDTELRGHVNRATMELHRLELKMRALQQRQGDIEAELSAARAYQAAS